MMADNDQDQPRAYATVPQFSLKAEAGEIRGDATVGLRGAEAKAEAGEVTYPVTSHMGGVNIETAGAPFSEAAERLAADPEFYKRLARFAAAELRSYADTINTQGQANAASVIKGRVTEVADGFDDAATALETQNGILTPEAAAKAAAIISKVRDAFSALCSDHRDLLRIARICFAGMALYQFGHVPDGWAGLIATAVIGGQEVFDIIRGPKGKDKDEP